MKIALFYHSLVSDWNHGNAHFLRGICSEMQSLGHEVVVFEPLNGWSYKNMLEEGGKRAVNEFHNHFPNLKYIFYDINTSYISEMLSGADLVIVHEWNDPKLVEKIGNHRKNNNTYKLLFHDTHHRAVTDKKAMEAFDLSGYDGVLAFGEVIKNLYLENGWTTKAWTWHEAADTNIFKPVRNTKKEGDLVWIGNWGDEERTEELIEFLINPVKELRLKAKIYGVRYSEEALALLKDAGIEYGGWIANFHVPEVFSKYSLTIHVPRRPYVESLPGIPTIRPFEAMACGIPLISSPWSDSENLFTAGKDYLVAHSGDEMRRLMMELLAEKRKATALTKNALKTINSSHTCKHRVNELMNIYKELTSTPKLTIQQETLTV
jgi:spore maturation protein CgeB